MQVQQSAKSTWKGPVIEGAGMVATHSNVLNDTKYSFVSRTKENIPNQTNPEELIAAAHSSCYSMYLSLLVTQKGYTINYLTTTATVKLKQSYDDLAIEEIGLAVIASIDGIELEEFQELAEVSKFKCPISKALAVVPIILTEVKLEAA
jgi:lipoyl-dependent peroxiredoxin